MKNPKTLKTLPYQVVEITVTDNFLCPVQALDAWTRAREIKPIGAKPLFAYPGGQELVPPKCMNMLLKRIFPGANLTASCFRS